MKFSGLVLSLAVGSAAAFSPSSFSARQNTKQFAVEVGEKVEVPAPAVADAPVEAAAPVEAVATLSSPVTESMEVDTQVESSTDRIVP